MLLVTRFKEIARFTALSGDWGQTLLFTAYQFPLILPIAIPISALIASLLLFQKLSQTHELTALRSSGLSLLSILTPLLLASFLLSMLNFSICAEMAPFCRQESKTMLFNKTTANPLLLLHRQKLVRLKNAFVEMDLDETGQHAKNFLFITHNDSNQRLNLLHARSLVLKQKQLIGKDVAILSHLEGNIHQFDPLILENQAHMRLDAHILSQHLKKSSPKLQATSAPLKMLLIQKDSAEKNLSSSAWIELFRRFSLSLAAFSFTLLGSTYGITEVRQTKQKNFSLICLTISVLASYLLGKELKAHLFLAFLIFALPHLCTWIISSMRLAKIARGRLT